MATIEWTSTPRDDGGVSASATARGFHLSVNGNEWGTQATALGYASGRSVVMIGKWLDTTPENIELAKTEAVEMARDLAQLGVSTTREPVSAIAGLTPDEGDHHVFPASA